MKNFLVAMIIALVSTVAMAKGTLTLKPGVDSNGQKQFMTGLSVYEPLTVGNFKLGYNAWIGGAVYNTDSKNWVKIDNSIETYVGRAAFGIGGSIGHGGDLSPFDNPDANVNTVYATVKVTLWK